MTGSREVIADRFLLLEPIGNGNMGEVFRAEDLKATDSADRVVAVKRLLRTRIGSRVGPGPEAERFEREVQIMRELDHHNLPHALDGGVDDSGLPYLAMEYVDGRPLSDLLTDGRRLPIAWVAAIGAQIADGLSAAHAKGVVHRDLKPSNVMIEYGGRVKVLDFGMGRIIDDADAVKLTSTGVTVGTARYMAPEQFEASAVGPAADFYALGCVLFELLTGTPPFRAESIQELGEEHRKVFPPPIRSMREDVPAKLARLIDRLLMKKPADRPMDVTAVRQALLSIATGSDTVPGWEKLNPLACLDPPVAAKPTPPAPEPRSLGTGMDVFGVHRQLIADYREFTEGGTIIRDQRIKVFVTKDLNAKSQWPAPWLSLNPFFADGGTVPELATDGVLHEECTRIFRIDKTESDDGRPILLHRHQREAIDIAKSGASYVLTTGTGSGKSLAYIVPIVDRVLRRREQEGPQARKRVRAIIVYPMNALANSQLNELDKFLRNGYGHGHEPVTYARYTGQESDERRKEIRADPPDILLTNYMMLELMLTRPEDRRTLVKVAQGLEFLVLDELHTYRGRQGADVALLVRRVREACQADRLQCIGTSATMSTEGTFADQQAAVADVARTLFGTDVDPAHVIGETLVRATEPEPEVVPAERLRIAEPPRAYADLVSDPLARWIETQFGLEIKEGRLVRQRPTQLESAANMLAKDSGVGLATCVGAIQATLEAGSQARHPETNSPLFVFRLHQFLSKGDTVYVTLEDKDTRDLTRNYQRIQPDSGGKILLPLAFCRDCGQEYLTVWRTTKDGEVRYEPRVDTTGSGGKVGDGYLYIDADRPWPSATTDILRERRLPESWLELDDSGYQTVREAERKYVPWAVVVDAYGVEGKGTLSAAFIPAPFRFCLHCGVNYEQRKGRDFAKLATLGQEGRSSATSLVSASIIRSLDRVPPGALKDEARKLLTFVDNRQDASLQAGHFNDFAQIVTLRGALYRAVREAGEQGLRHEDVAARVTEALGLSVADYTKEGDPPPSLAALAARTLRDVVSFRLYLDLRRGWRVTMPNLEQTGLLKIYYEDLDWLAGREDRWSSTHPSLRNAEPGQRAEILRVLLDEMRRSLTIDVQHFREDFQTLQRASEERLRDPWVLSRSDNERVGAAYPWGRKPGMDTTSLYLSGRGKFGRYLRRIQFPRDNLSTDDAQQLIAELLEVLADASMAQRVQISPQYVRRGQPRPAPVTGYQLPARILIWRAGTGEAGVHDPLTRGYASGEGPRVNPFFLDLYQNMAGALRGVVAREHTAQVDQVTRGQREEEFRKGELKLLYCSPTLELGVDISELSAVMMRNVPPTPANYVQRGGRAGRSGRPALITTYCATGNSHDQYYFRRSDRMVAGVITRPRLDLSNEDLIRSHVQAIWLAESELRLGQSVLELVDTGDPRYELLEHVSRVLAEPSVARRTADAARTVLGGLLGDLVANSSWWHEQWIDDVVRAIPRQFDEAFERWRDLFRAATADQEEQNRRVLDHTLTEKDRQTAVGRRRAAEAQLRLLRNETPDNKSVLADFNPYRYLASEGFLPGYSFPRLPLAAYIPGAGGRFDDGDYLQRPRFLAIREFGPGALIYHEGSRYQVTHIQLPADASGDVTTTSAKRCPGCGYHHDEQDAADDCQMCHGPLPEVTYGLLKLHTVYTRRRERISSDEEERRRAGFRLVTSYRFQDHGVRPGRRDATITDDTGEIVTVTYGDSATVRITNIGLLRAKDDEAPGFWLDPTTGEWLRGRAAAEATGDSSELPVVGSNGKEKGHKKRVIPYVEDRRNIVVLRLAEPLPRGAALSLMYALERGIEAKFELEDSELASELLPPEDGPCDRMLFMEAAEGGAGVLRLMQSAPKALAHAAAAALDICHFDRDGNDRGGADPERPCARGCYDCLLTYGNQLNHGVIDRHAARDLLVRLAGATAAPAIREETRAEKLARLTQGSESPLIAWLRSRGLRLPDEEGIFIADALARPDYIYRRDGLKLAVFVDGSESGPPSQRDADAEERLYDNGWDVVRFPRDGDWDAIVKQFEECFGVGA